MIEFNDTTKYYPINVKNYYMKWAHDTYYILQGCGAKMGGKIQNENFRNLNAVIN